MQTLELGVVAPQSASALDLGIEELDENIAPGFWEDVAGIATGSAIGLGVFYIGVTAAT